MRITFIVVASVLAASLLASSAQATPIQWSSGTGHNDHWYEAVLAPSGITWTAASANAASVGGYLATILSGDENTFVFNLINSPTYWTNPSGPYIGPWLGGFQVSCSPEPSCGWTWLNGDGSFAAGSGAYTNWNATEPSNGVGSPHGLAEAYLHYFDYGGRNSTWNDLPNDLSGAGFANPIAYVVEYNSNPTAAPVPEPTTIVLIGSALVAAVRRKSLISTISSRP